MAREHRRWARWRRRALVLGALAAVAWPILSGRDSYPLSTYPMYATARSRVATFATAVGVDADGEIRRLSLDAIAGTDDPLIAESMVADAVRSGRADRLCAQIAARAPSDSREVLVVQERHDVVNLAIDRESLLGRSTIARCPVVR